MDPMAAIRETFFQECDEQLGELESGLMAMEQGGNDPEIVNAVFRAVHSIKGGAGAFGLDALVRFAHVFETSLDRVRSGKMEADPEALRLMLQAADILTDLVRGAHEDTPVDEGRVNAVATALQALNGAAGSAAAHPADDGLMGAGDDLVFQPLPVALDSEEAAGDECWIVTFAPRMGFYTRATEPILLVRELARLGGIEVTLDKAALPDLAAIDPEEAYLSWTIRLKADCPEAVVRDVFDFVEDECVLTIARSSEDAGLAPAVAHQAADIGSVLPGDPSDADIMSLIGQLQSGAAEPPATGQTETVTVPPAGIAAPAVPGSRVEAAPAATRAEAVAPVAATIRVDLDRVDRLIDLVGELVINGSMLVQRVSEAGLLAASGVTTALDELDQLTREIQDSVMAIRAQPVRSVFQRMPRLVREVAAMTGKQVRLLTEGEGTEVDKTVIERIADPLTHMIRNAIDHGLESPSARLAAGKPAEGVVKLSALHRSGRIVIEVEDDGAGINRARVRAKAIDAGLIAPDAALTDEETDNLIFLPGFSTASTVSDISGRGVGMDVVRRSVQALGGRISIVSRPGLGSTFVLSLPLTLAVLDGMVVTIAGHTLIVPLSAMLESLQPRAETMHTLGRDGRVMTLRGGCIPLIDVGRVLGYRAEAADPERCVALLVEGEGGVQAILLVDAIQGQRQVVIKTLETNYRTIHGIAAATVMGDGRVALILDVDAIVSVVRSDGGRAAPSRPDLAMLEAGGREGGRWSLAAQTSNASATSLSSVN